MFVAWSAVAVVYLVLSPWPSVYYLQIHELSIEGWGKLY